MAFDLLAADRYLHMKITREDADSEGRGEAGIVYGFMNL